MSFYNIIAKNVILPLADRKTGWNIKKHLDFLNKSQWWSKEQLKEYQNVKLQKLIIHAYQNIPYYNNLFKKHGIIPSDIKTKNDLNIIPVITKEEVTNNVLNGSLIAKNLNLKKHIKSQSSGSTGFKTIFYIDPNSYGLILACNLRGWDWMGYHLGDKMIKISHNKRNSTIKKLQDKLDRVKLFNDKYDSKGFKEFYNLFNNYHPSYLRSYPDPLFFLSIYAKKHKLKFTGLKAINTTGNILFPEVRQLVENIFNVKIFDSYSCEGGPNVFECETHENYHVSDEYGIIEIIDVNGNEVEEGKDGRAIVTALDNYITPFIRYDSKDILTKGGSCSCGRSLTTISKIVGRDNDIIITPQGQMLIAQTFTTYFKYIDGVDQFQVIQNKEDELKFKIKKNIFYNDEINKKIVKYWQNYTYNNMKIFIEEVENIPLLSSGKRRFLIRNKKIKLDI